MYTTTVHQNGDSLVLSIPDELKERLHLEAGEQVSLAVEGDHLLLARRRSHYTLEQLLQEHAKIADQLEDDRAWLDAKPVGRELL
ncbi:MAG TPA: hypothetical protein VGG18_13625 [Granulicella sp.]|jgi:antitoxin ChpS